MPYKSTDAAVESSEFYGIYRQQELERKRLEILGKRTDYKSNPKFSELMPTADELTSPEAIQNLPSLRAQYEKDEANKLDAMRRPNPLLDPSWGKSKQEIISEAKQLKQEEERKAKLMEMLDQYTKEDDIKQQLKSAKDSNRISYVVGA